MVSEPPGVCDRMEKEDQAQEIWWISDGLNYSVIKEFRPEEDDGGLVILV